MGIEGRRSDRKESKTIRQSDQEGKNNYEIQLRQQQMAKFGGKV